MPNDRQRIEIITGRERRRRYTAHEKVRFVEETMQSGMTGRWWRGSTTSHRAFYSGRGVA